MQHFKQINWKKFLLQGVLPCLLAVAVGFISRYQLELSDGVTPSFLELQWPLYAPLNALTAFCLTLILFAVPVSFTPLKPSPTRGGWFLGGRGFVYRNKRREQ